MIHEFLAGTENHRSVHATADDLMLSRRQKSFTFDITSAPSLPFERKLFYLAHFFRLALEFAATKQKRPGHIHFFSSCELFFHTLLVNIGFDSCIDYSLRGGCVFLVSVSSCLFLYSNNCASLYRVPV